MRPAIVGPYFDIPALATWRAAARSRPDGFAASCDAFAFSTRWSRAAISSVQGRTDARTIGAAQRPGQGVELRLLGARLVRRGPCGTQIAHAYLGTVLQLLGAQRGGEGAEAVKAIGDRREDRLEGCAVDLVGVEISDAVVEEVVDLAG